MHFDQQRALLIFAAFFGRALSRRGNGDATFLRNDANRFGKRTFLHFHHEFENVSADSAAKAVINLSRWMNVERRRFFGVKWAQARENSARLFQLNVFADHANNVRLLLDAIRE